MLCSWERRFQARGHHVVVHAPDPTGKGFFRAVRCGAALMPAAEVRGGLQELVEQRIGEYVKFVEGSSERYDVYHAHDGISANALAELAERGRIPGFVRTVHHLDGFDSQRLRDWQDRSVLTAGRCFCVSVLWRRFLKREYGIDADVVPNGVDLKRYSPEATPLDAKVRESPSANGPAGLPLGRRCGGAEEHDRSPEGVPSDPRRAAAGATGDRRRGEPARSYDVSRGV